MSKHDAFIAEFNELLKKFPEHSSLAQWQYAYRSVAYSMGLEILRRFPEAVVGPEPSEHRPVPSPPPEMRMLSAGGPPTASAAGSGGTGGGKHPNIVCRLVCTILDVT
jgi:hypothetical protein